MRPSLSRGRSSAKTPRNTHAAGVAQTHREAGKRRAADPRGHQKNPEEWGGGVLSRNQLSNNTDSNSTFAFGPGGRPNAGHSGPKQKSPPPRRAKQPEGWGQRGRGEKDFPWHSSHLSHLGRGRGWVGIGTFRCAKVASGSRSLVSRRFCIKLENCSPSARSTGLVLVNVRENFFRGQIAGSNFFCGPATDELSSGACEGPCHAYAAQNYRKLLFGDKVLRKLRMTDDILDPSKHKKATLKQSGFSHLFSAKKYLETR